MIVWACAALVLVAPSQRSVLAEIERLDRSLTLSEPSLMRRSTVERLTCKTWAVWSKVKAMPSGGDSMVCMF